MVFEGFVDVVDAAAVRGWVWCPDEPTVRPTVLLIDETFSVLAKAVAQQYRADVAETGHHDGCYGFSIDLASIEDARSELHALVVVEPTWQPLCKDRLHITVPKRQDQGHLDTLADDVLKGWYRPADDAEPGRVTIFVDGQETAVVVADEYRADLEEAGLGDGKWGFSCPVPPHLCDGLEHTFTALAPGGDCLGDPLCATTSAWKYSPYVGDCAPLSRQFDPLRGWLYRVQGTVNRIGAPDAAVPVALQADDALIMLAFSDPEAGGTFDILVPRETLLCKGFHARLSLTVHGEDVTLSHLSGTVGELLALG